MNAISERMFHLERWVRELEVENAAINTRIGDVWLRQPESEVEPSGNDLLDRLNGIYTIPVNDGAGPLNGSMTFTRRFPTLKLNKEAAERIVELEAALKPFADYAKPIDENRHEDHLKIGYYTAESPTAGDCRHAAAVLAKGKE